MQIEEQIKALLRTKAKIDLYRNLLDHVGAFHREPIEPEHPGMVAEFVEEVSGYLSKQIDFLGNPQTANPVPPQSPFVPITPELLEKSDKPPRQAQPTPVVAGEPTDPLLFLKKYRYLDSKRVVVRTPDGEVGAVVRGVKPPFLVVETETGYIANVAPNTVREA